MMPRATATFRLMVATLLLAIATAAGLLAMRVLVLGGWHATGLRGIAVVAAAVIAVRLAIGGRKARIVRALRAGAYLPGKEATLDNGGAYNVLPTLAGLLTAGLFLLVEFGGLEPGTNFGIEPESIDRLLARFGESWELIHATRHPLEPEAPVVLVLVTAALAIFLLADFLGVTLRLPLLAALPVVALWFPNLVLSNDLPWGTFAVGTLALLLLLTLDDPGTPTMPRRATSRLVRRAGHRRAAQVTAFAAAVTAVSLVASSAAAGVNPFFGDWDNIFSRPGTRWSIGTNIDFRTSLAQRSNATLLTYRITDEAGRVQQEDVGPLRLLTMAEFDGRRWIPSEFTDARPFDSGTLQGGADLRADIAWSGQSPALNVEMNLAALSDFYLPIPMDPRTVDTRGVESLGWRWDPVSDTVTSPNRTTPGDTVGVTIYPRSLSVDLLRAFEFPMASPGPEYLQIPRTPHAARIAQVADSIVGDRTRPLEQLLALQTYFRMPGNFTYQYNVPRGATGDAVFDFLTDRRGYCVQFATSMVVMARMLGMPARMAVGLLPGTAAADGTFTITGLDAHAWPEIYFAGAGWVRFEPTPASQTGVAPQYTQLPIVIDDVEIPSPEDEVPDRPDNLPEIETPAPGGQGSAPGTAGDGTVATEEQGGTNWQIWLWIGALAAAMAGGLLALWRWRRHRPLADAEEAWTRVTRAYQKAGLELPPDTTPRRSPEVYASAWQGVFGQVMPAEVRQPLTKLANAVEAERYQNHPVPAPPGHLSGLVHLATSSL